MRSQMDSPAKMTILFIDHDKASLERIVDKISEEVATSTMKSVGKTYNLRTLLMEPEPTETLASRTIAEIVQKEQLPDLILVDLSFDNKARDGSVQIGRELAQAIRSYFSDIAVGVYSRFELSPRDKGLISADKFALRLDEFRKMFENLARPMTGDDWNDVFQGVRRKALDEARALSKTFPHLDLKNIMWAEGHPLNRSVGFETAARALVAKTVGDISDGGRIVLTQLSNSFSSSYLVKTEIVGGASILVKIDENPNKLLKELSGYRRLPQNLYKYYSAPLNSDGQPVHLRPDWWGAFAVQYEAGAEPLLENFPSTGAELVRLYQNLWNDCLFNLYGVTNTQLISSADIVGKPSITAAHNSWKSMSRYKEWFTSPPNNSRTEAIEDLLTNLTLEEVSFHSRSLEVPWINQVHGNLNCRNILYEKETGSFRLVDFPLGNPNCLAFDFVRAEAELLLIMLDWSTGRDCDFERLTLWESISKTLSSAFVPNAMTFHDIEADQVFLAIKAIRKLYKDRADEQGNVDRAYLTYLFSRVLRYSCCMTLTVQKRYFAFLWASQLSVALANA